MKRFLVTVSAFAICAAYEPAYAAGFLTPDASAEVPATTLNNTSTDETTLSSIVVSGNQRIEASTIETYMGLTEGQSVTRYDIDNALKKLYDTGFFADIQMKQDGNTLQVTVVENPSISKVAFEGNERIKDEDLAKEVTLRARSIYSRPKVQSDVKRLLDVYRRNGRYSAKVEPKVIKLDQNRVDLVYEVSEGPVSEIRKIAFIGNSAFSASQLEGIIKSETGSWYKFLSNSTTYDPDRLQFDQEMLRRFYQSQGYADFQVKSAVAELSPEKDAFFLTFTIDEGPQYTLNKVDVASELKGDKKPDLSASITTAAGDVYDASEVETCIDNMVNQLGDLGYAFVDIDPDLKRDKTNHTVDLTYRIKEGPRVYVEKVNITGNVRTLDEVVRREFRLAEGDAYSTSKLRRTEQRLNNLGFFEKVNINTEKGSAADKTVINVDVEEKSTGEISLGAGYSTSDGPLADLGIRERNLLGRGQDLKLRAMIAARREQFDIGFTEPYFLDRDVEAGVNLYKTTQDMRSESSFDRNATGATTHIAYSLGEKLRHSLRYSAEKNEIDNIRSDASPFVKAQEGENTTSMIGQSLIYEDRNNKFDPTSGSYLRFNQDVAGLGGDDRFLRHEVQGEYYIPVADQWTVAMAGSLGHMVGVGEDVRINQRFFIGGREVRGFDNSGIGPRDISTDDALGGNYYYTASSELRFPLGLPDDLGFTGAAFLDVGSLWGSDDAGPTVRDNNSMRMAAGVGMSWKSPFGPIRVDLAKPIMKEDYDVDQIFRFSFGTRF